jgi:hypothetical protein
VYLLYRFIVILPQYGRMTGKWTMMMSGILMVMRTGGIHCSRRRLHWQSKSAEEVEGSDLNDGMS